MVAESNVPRPSLPRLLRAWLYRHWHRTRIRTTGSGHRIQLFDSLLEGCSVELTGKNNRLEIHPRARLWGVTLRLVGENLNCRIGGQCRLSGGEYLLQDHGSLLEIGSGTTIFNPTIAVNEGGYVRVGSDCLVAAGVDIRNSDAHSLLDATSRVRLNPARNVVIEDHVWIGTHSQILKGVT